MKNLYERWTGRELNKETGRDILKLAMPIFVYAPIYLYWFFILRSISLRIMQ